MKNIHNIDELLKNSFEGFEATPPANAWSGIQQGISNTPSLSSQSSVSKIATVVKSASIITKVALVAVTSGVVLGGGFLAYKYFNKKEITETKIAAQQTQTPQIIEQKVDKNSSTQNQNLIIEEKATSPAHQKEKVDKISDEKLNQVVVDNGNKTETINSVSQPSNQNKTVVNSVQKTEQKQPLPKPKHNFSSPEKNTSSATNTDENNFVKPNIPNYLSPNGDGVDDRFDIAIENESYYHLRIFDSKEQLVFESNSKEKMWDGTKMNLGEPCDVGEDYFYVFNYKYTNSEIVHTAKGAIKIVR